ncbi:patatin-like phospholipase family protein [Anaeroselena agilis]|uniref:Patatin-like phospholipase family protein n=1 Tax=Anaeroselena agilis TaxID=3063788 RepID=A0ABU3NX99_9FIRM|nr:patatin-like phospholipase family protein [Selenomonadales bacterium 4137-cl]
MGERIVVKVNGRGYGRRPKVGVALSGGGVRGAAHIGVLRVLAENNIPVDMIAGTSAGAVIATLYACGYQARELESMAATLKAGELIDLKLTVGELFKQGVKWLFGNRARFWSVLPGGIVKGDKIERYLAGLVQRKTFKDTRIPLAVTAVDAISGDTVFFVSPREGWREILNARYFTAAPLSEAVRASISVPGIFSPKKYRGLLLVDGAVKNNLPTDILHHMGAEVIIAVDLGYSGQPNEDLRTVSEIVLQCIDIMNREVTLLKGVRYADIVIRPEVFDIGFKQNGYMAQCIARGAKAAWELIGEIGRLTKG